jgi:predicted P-loop ATPase
MSRKALVQAVKRTFEPGCQADYMLVIEGIQGICKDSAIRALFPDPRWVLFDVPKRLDDDNTRRLIQEAAIVVFDELHTFDPRRVNEVKAFVTRREDQWVEKWESFQTRRPRRCVIFGTSNRQDWNHDPTGARRYWPIWCGAKSIDVEAIEATRDQIWAEALHRYRDGERAWIDDAELLKKLEEEQADRRDVDDWHNDIAAAVAGKDKVDPAWIYNALRIPKKDRGGKNGSRIKEVMLELGYRYQTIRLPGHPKNLKGYQLREEGESCDE